MDNSYPQGLKSEDIMVEARILAVADIIESMSTLRPYRPALGLKADPHHSGSLYDPRGAAVTMHLSRGQDYPLP